MPSEPRALLERLLTSSARADRRAAYRDLRDATERDGAPTEDAAALVGEVADLLFASASAIDVALVARIFAHWTLGPVHTLEVRGADRVGTHLRGAIDARRSDVAALIASDRPDRAHVGLWLATVAGFYELVPALGTAPSEHSAALVLAWAHVARHTRRTRGAAPEADAYQDLCAAWFAEAKGGLGPSRGLAIAAAVGAVLAHPYFDGFADVPHAHHAFLRGLPEDLVIDDFPFGCGEVHAFAADALLRTYAERAKAVELSASVAAQLPPEIAALLGVVVRAEPEHPEAEQDHPEIDEDETNPYMLERPGARGASLVELPGLDAVDFRSLEDAYGHAGAVPTFLRAVASSDQEERRFGLDALQAGINHQGGTFSASVAAVPFLVDLAMATVLPNRPQILALLLGLATGEPGWALLEHAYPTLCLEPIAAAAPRLVALLDDEDLVVRAAAIHLLGYLEPAAATVAPACARRLPRERSPYLRASLGMAMARVCRRTADAGLTALVEETLRGIAEEPVLGAAVATVAVFYARAELSAAEREALHALDERGLVVPRLYGWSDGLVSGHARLVHGASMGAEEALLAVERGERDRENRAWELLFPKSIWRGDDLWLPEELSEQQLRLLRAAAKREQGFYIPRWRDAGLPVAAVWLARFVGAEPEGPLDRRAPVARPGGEVRWPRWKILHAVVTGLLPTHAWERATDEMEDAELLAVFEEATSPRYELAHIRADVDDLDPEARGRGRAHRDRLYRTLLDALVKRDGLMKEMRRRADALLASGERDHLRATLAFAALGLEAARKGTWLEARDALLAAPGPSDWSPSMTLTEPLRWGLERLPMDARAAWFRGLELVSLTRVEDVRGVRHRVWIRTGWEFLDLIATAEGEALLVDALRTLADHDRGEGDPEAHQAGLSSGPLITWDKDDPLPIMALRRVANAWGARWTRALSTVEPLLTDSLRGALRGSN